MDQKKNESVIGPIGELNFHLNGKPLSKFPKYIVRYEDKFIMRLFALNLDTKSGEVTPIYKQVFAIERHPGQFAASVFIKGKVHTLIFDRINLVAYERYTTEPDLEDENGG